MTVFNYSEIGEKLASDPETRDLNFFEETEQY